jgi:hypothetical protein
VSGAEPPPIRSELNESSSGIIAVSSSSSSSSSFATTTEINRIKVKVRVKDRVLLIPISSAENTIAWLCEEVRKRYSEKTGAVFIKKSKNVLHEEYIHTYMCITRNTFIKLTFLSGQRPILTLTIGGAELHFSDSVCSILVDNEEVTAQISGWDMKPLEERYDRAVTAEDSKTKPYKNIRLLMMAAQTSRRLKVSMGLRTEQLRPIIAAVKFQSDLVELDLSMNKLGGGEEAATILCDALRTISNLRILDLSCNMLTAHFARKLEESFAAEGGALSSLTTMDLSYNLLGDGSSQPLAALCGGRLQSLETLNLESSLITSEFWHGNRGVWTNALSTGILKKLILSFNDFIDADEVEIVGHTGICQVMFCSK